MGGADQHGCAIDPALRPRRRRRDREHGRAGVHAPRRGQFARDQLRGRLAHGGRPSRVAASLQPTDAAKVWPAASAAPSVEMGAVALLPEPPAAQVPALQDRALDQATRGGGRDPGRRWPGRRRPTARSTVTCLGLHAERRDVRAHPAERRHQLIHQAVVARGVMGLCAESAGKREVAERAEAIASPSTTTTPPATVSREPLRSRSPAP